MNTPELSSKTLSRHNCDLHYRYRPTQNGAWAIFLHGAGMDGHMFDAQFAAIPTQLGIICWDARGHGDSTLTGAFHYSDMLADLSALIRTVGARDVVLVGQSMGGNLAQSFVDTYPDAVSRLVLIDCTANHGPISFVDKMALRSTRWVLSAYPWKLTVQQSARACGLKSETMAYAENCLRRIGKKRFIDVMDFWRQALTPDASYRLPVPTLALVGDQDRSGNIAKALRDLASCDPSVQLETIPNAAHNSNMDEPEVTNSALRRFLRA